MDKTRLYHALSGTFGALVLAWSALRLSSSLTLVSGLVAVAGAAMLLISGVALARPDLDDTAEPPAWKVAVLAVGVLLFGVGGLVELL